MKTGLEKQDGVTLAGFIYVRKEQVASCCKAGKGLAANFVENLRKCRSLKAKSGTTKKLPSCS